MSSSRNRISKTGKPPRLRVVGRDEEKLSEFQPADRQYFKDLHLIVDEVFNEAANTNGWTWGQLADNAGLAYQTVANLGDRKTKWPQFRTIWRLCKAVNWDLITKRNPKNLQVTLKLAKAS